jgi:hypothetical protein
MNSHKINQINFIFSASAAERILKIPTLTVSFVKVNNNMTVTVKTKQQEYILPTRLFTEDFATSRQERSKNLKLNTTKYGNVYLVSNLETNSKYPVRVTDIGVECKCRDFQKQQEQFGSGCCKHGYRVLRELGYQNLGEYLIKNKVAA